MPFNFDNLSTDPMFQMGIGILGQNGTFGNMIGRGAVSGMTAVTQERQARQQELFKKMQIAQYQAQQAALAKQQAIAEQQRQQQMQANQAYRATLPESQQPMYDVNPSGYQNKAVEAQFRKPSQFLDTMDQLGVDISTKEGRKKALEIYRKQGTTTIQMPGAQERKAAGALAGAQASGERANELEAAGVDSSDIADYYLGKIPVAGNWLMSPAGREYKAQMNNWGMTFLRDDSGAALGKDEMEKALVRYWPVPGDDETTKNAKRVMRRNREKQMELEAGRAAGKAVPEQFSKPIGGASNPIVDAVEESVIPDQGGEWKFMEAPDGSPIKYRVKR